jgi:hypothetical protein
MPELPQQTDAFVCVDRDDRGPAWMVDDFQISNAVVR